MELLERYGLPLARVQSKLVHGCCYVRPLGVGEREGSKPKAPPPALVMKVLVRLHPTLRRRARTAKLAWQERRWRDEVDQWFARDRSAQVARNLALQAVELTDLDDASLADHVAEALAHFEESARRNLASHGGDLMPVGDLLAHCEAWEIPPNEVAGLLTGSSPATVETAELLRPVALAMVATGAPATSLGSVDDVRALTPEAREAVDAWLELHMWRTVTSDDVDRSTLAEVPALQLAALLHAVDHLEVEALDEATVRTRVPPDHRALFDDLLVEARATGTASARTSVVSVGTGPVVWCGALSWRPAAARPTPVVYRDVGHAVELFPDELGRLLRGGPGPSAEVLAERSAQRDLVEATPPPRTLGEPEAPPPMDALPPAMARATAAMMASLEADVTPPEPGTDAASMAATGRGGAAIGIGIGQATYRGRACVVHDLMDAFDQLEPGDVLVAPFTGPSINSLLPVLGALVVEEGGAMCHAAIVAREFGLPAVIGARDATIRVPHGAQVEVDGSLGLVRLL